MVNGLKNKDGNAFIIGLLIVFAGIGIGTIILTYKDYQNTRKYGTINVDTEEYNYSDLGIPFILNSEEH